MRTIENSTLGQLFNFVLFASSLLLFINNVLDINFKLNQLEYNLENNIGILHDMVLLLAALIVCMLTIHSPYEHAVDDKSVASLVTEVTIESFKTIVFITCLLYVSTSTVVEDPMVLFNTIFDVIDKRLGVIEILDLDININELDRELLTTLGLDYITFTNFAKILTLFGAFIYILVIFVEHPPTSVIRQDMLDNWKSSTVPRMLLLWIWAFNVSAFFVNVVGTDVNGLDGTFMRNTKTIFTSFTDLGSMRSALVDPQYQNIIQDLSVGALLIVTFYIIAFYRHYEYGAVVLLGAIVQNVDKMDDLLIDNVMFETNLWLMIVMSGVMLAVFIRFCWNNRSDYEVVLQVLPDILYKVGNILCIGALFFMLISIRYDWLDFDFQPSSVSRTVADSIEDAAERIDSVVTTLGSVATVLDPCSHRPTIQSVSDTVTATDANSLDQVLIDARESIRNTGIDDAAICIEPSTPFNFVNLGQSQCLNLKTDFDTHRQDLIDKFESNAQLEGLKSYDPESDSENELFVDQSCVDAKCTALTVVTVAAVALSFVPFMGGASKAVTMAARAAFRVFKIGRRLTKSLPRMLKKRRKIKKLASRIVRLAAATTGHAGFEEDMAIIYLPLIILATASVSIIMFRRGIKHKPGDGYSSLLSRSISLRLVLGLFGPLALAETAFYLTLHVMPIFVNGILKELPTVLVLSELDVNIGYTSLKLAYFFSASGAILVCLSAILFAFENSLLVAIKYTISGIKYVYRKLFRGSAATGADTSTSLSKWSKCKVFCYNLTMLFTNWNTPYFQPLVFASPAIYFIYRGIINNEKYIIMSYGSNDDVAKATDEILETVLHKERSEGMHIDFDAMNCGAVAKLVKEIISVVPGGLPGVNLGLSEFTNAISGAFSGAQDFVSHLSDLVDLDFINIELPDIFPSFMIPLLIFGMPIIALGALVLLWVISIFVDGFGDIKNIGKALFSADHDEPSYYATVSRFYGSFASTVAMFSFYTAVINVLVHIVVGGIVISSFNTDLPFLKINSEFGPAYFDTQYASLFIMMGALSIYINVLIPVDR